MRTCWAFINGVVLFYSWEFLFGRGGGFCEVLGVVEEIRRLRMRRGFLWLGCWSEEWGRELVVAICF